jgi:hypothetical protein
VYHAQRVPSHLELNLGVAAVGIGVADRDPGLSAWVIAKAEPSVPKTGPFATSANSSAGHSGHFSRSRRSASCTRIGNRVFAFGI